MESFNLSHVLTGVHASLLHIFFMFQVRIDYYCPAFGLSCPNPPVLTLYQVNVMKNASLYLFLFQHSNIKITVNHSEKSMLLYFLKGPHICTLFFWMAWVEFRKVKINKSYCIRTLCNKASVLLIQATKWHFGGRSKVLFQIVP